MYGQQPVNGQPLVNGQIITEPISSTNSSTIEELGNNKVKMNGQIYKKVEKKDRIVYELDDSSQNSSQFSFPSQTSNLDSEFYSEAESFEYVWNYSNDKLTNTLILIIGIGLIIASLYSVLT